MLPLLQSYYIHETGGVEDFLTSIDLLRQPLLSKEYLRQVLNRTSDLAPIPVYLTAGIINYETGTKVRIDGNTHVHTILDDVAAVLRDVMAALDDSHPEKVARRSRQTPVCGLICTPDIPSPRELLVKFLRREGRSDMDVAGSVFLLTGINVRNPFSCFGPYKLGGICYSIMALGIKDYYIIGRNAIEAANIRKKVKNDPILSAIVAHFGVRFHVLTMPDILARGVHPNSTTVDMPTREVILESIRRLSSDPHQLSALGRPVRSRDVLKLSRI